MDREVMTNEENYCFDVAGYLHVPGTLTRPEVERLNREIDAMGATEGMLGWPGKAREPFRDLLVHPALVWYLNQLVGQGFILDRAPEVWCEETLRHECAAGRWQRASGPRHCVLLPERAAL